jgi:hypothetical protein
MTERYATFRQYDVQLPELTPAFMAMALRYAMAIVAIAFLLWLVSLFTKRRDESEVTP